MPTSSRIVLLDTHVWIWLINGDDRLKLSKALKLSNQAGRHSNVRIPVISLWEIGMLEVRGRITLPNDCLNWVNNALKAPGITLQSITPEIAILSSRLPGNFHGDPVDRIIVTTTRVLDAVLITADKKILEYGKKNYEPIAKLCSD